MQRQAPWRALAVTYAVVAGMQVYLAASTNAAWALALGAVFALAAVGFGFAAWRGRRLPVGNGLPELAPPVMTLASETRNTVNSRNDLRPRH